MMLVLLIHSCSSSEQKLTQLAVVSRIYNTKNINKVISQAALKKLQNHMWYMYLGSEMAPLSLFSSKVCEKEKKSIVGAMILRR